MGRDPHIYAHVSELCYHAVRRAILPTYPRPRDKDGRFISRVETKAAQLRAELSHTSLAQAISEIRGDAA